MSCKVTGTHSQVNLHLQHVRKVINFYLVVPVLWKWYTRCSDSSCMKIRHQMPNVPVNVGYSWSDNISHSWSFLTNRCICNIPNSLTSVCFAVDCRQISCTTVFQVFTLHLYHLLTTVLCTDKIYYKETRQWIQPGKMSSIFLIWIIDRWMNKWKQQQNIYRVMKTVEGKTLNKRHAWNCLRSLVF